MLRETSGSLSAAAETKQASVDRHERDAADGMRRAASHVRQASSDVGQSIDHVVDAMRESWEQRKLLRTRTPTFDEMRGQFANLLRPTQPTSHQFTVLSPQIKLLDTDSPASLSFSHTVQSNGADSLIASLSHSMHARELEHASSAASSDSATARAENRTADATASSIKAHAAATTAATFERATHAATVFVPLSVPSATQVTLSSVWSGVRDVGVDLKAVARLSSRTVHLQHDVKTPYVAGSFGWMSGENATNRVGMAGTTLLYNDMRQLMVGAKVLSAPFGSTLPRKAATMSAILQATGPGNVSDVQVAGDVLSGEVTHVGVRTFTYSTAPDFPRAMFGLGVAAGVGGGSGSSTGTTALALWKTPPGLFDDVLAVQAASDAAATNAGAHGTPNVKTSASPPLSTAIDAAAPRSRFPWSTPVLTASYTYWASPASRWYLTADSNGAAGMQWAQQWSSLLNVQASVWIDALRVGGSGGGEGSMRMASALSPHMSLSVTVGEQ